MPRVLLTGMSGTGKSTVLRALAERGLRTVDTDDDDWAEEAPTPDGGIEQVWRADRMGALLADDEGSPLVVSGCASNQGAFYDRFDCVVLLSVPVDVLLSRIASRDTHSFGMSPAERRRILQDLEEVEPVLRATSTVEIDGTLPLPDVVDAVHALAVGPT